MRASLNQLIANQMLRDMPCKAHKDAEDYDCAEWLVMLDAPHSESAVEVVLWFEDHVVVKVGHNITRDMDWLTQMDANGDRLARCWTMTGDEVMFITSDEVELNSEIAAIDGEMLRNAL